MTKTKDKTKEYKIDLYDAKCRKLEKIELNKKVFDGRVNLGLLYDAVIMYSASRRRGSASTKTRAEVRGGGKKPWRQKGTGRARFGSIRNPIWRGGGVAFGPRPRDYSYRMPQKARIEALKSALNARLEDKVVSVFEEFEIESPKTKIVQAVLDKLKIEGRTLIVLEDYNENIKRATRNLDKVNIRRFDEVCAMDVISSESILLTKEALSKLTKRLQA